MSAWLDAYEQLSGEQKDRIQAWLHLQRFIAETLKLPFEKWIEHYVGEAMKAPFDYRFMDATLPGLEGFGVEGQGVSFSKDVDPATALVARVPLRAQNNLGKLSPALQDALAGMLESGEPAQVALSPADVGPLQKIFPREKALSKLKQKDFRKVVVERDDDHVVVRLEGGDELLRMNVMEMAGVMGRTLV